MSSPPTALWRSFVDSFATMGDGVLHSWVVERGVYPDSPEHEETNKLLASLTIEQRRVLAKMMIQSRHDGVFDALVMLHERMALTEGKYAEQGVEMAFEPHGYTLFQDYVWRRGGKPWHDSDDV